jgi:hypothetical protein
MTMPRVIDNFFQTAPEDNLTHLIEHLDAEHKQVFVKITNSEKAGEVNEQRDALHKSLQIIEDRLFAVVLARAKVNHQKREPS